MRSLRLLVGLTLLIGGPVAAAADEKAIDAAVKKGAESLEGRYKNMRLADRELRDDIGPPALAGLALLEAGKKTDDPAVKAIAAAVRDASYTEHRTYQLALCLLFLDRLGDRGDEPMIQLLAVRLLAGQNGNGGWTYDCISAVPQDEERRLRAKLTTNQLVAGGREPGSPAATKEPKDSPAPHVAGKLHSEVERHRQGLLANARQRIQMPDDNSNTQFAILAVWVARKHGVNVEPALEAIEKRFLTSQTPSGGWPYSGLIAADGSPAMTCAGLLGLATAVGRREERRLHAEVPKKPEPPKVPKKPMVDDPFFAPPPKPMEPKKAPPVPKAPRDTKDKAIERGLDNLTEVLGGQAVGRGRGRAKFGDKDFYFLWSLERVGVVYGLQKIGGHDWYQLGASILVPAQKADGSWGAGGYGSEVNTAFAILFLAKSNLVRDLSAKVQRDPLNAELRGGPSLLPGERGPAPMPEPRPVAEPAANGPTSLPPAPIVEPEKPKPLPASDEAAKLTEALLKVPAAAWPRALEQVRDGKGADFTRALALVIRKVDGDRRKEARDALAERLTRMSADTLRGMLKADDVELRRAAALACAMKDDKGHVPDLIERIAEDEEIVVRAARAGLKSLSGGKDFGPEAGFSRLDRDVAVEEWKAWWAKQKKN